VGVVEELLPACLAVMSYACPSEALHVGESYELEVMGYELGAGVGVEVGECGGATGRG